jgi:hypothetical protein
MKKVFKIFESLIDISFPLMILLYGMIGNLVYTPTEDTSGYGSLAVAAIFIGAIIWIGIIKLIEYIINIFVKKDIYKDIIKIIFVVVNIFIYNYTLSSVINDDIFTKISIMIIGIFILYLIFVKRKLVDKKS